MGDVHHIFPKQYLIDNGIKDKAKYNQVANFTYLDTPTNIAIGKDEPSVYFSKVWNQLINQNYVIGNLKTEDAIKKNLDDNCIPLEIKNWTFENYEEFLLQRRKLMAAKIKEYYEKLANENQLSNCPLCAISDNANKTRIWKLSEMDADHVTAWSKGGATDITNCQMLCITHNRAKGNR